MKTFVVNRKTVVSILTLFGFVFLVILKPTDSIASMENTTEQNADAPEKIPLRWHSGLHVAGVASDIVLGGLGVGGEVGVSYTTPTYAVSFEVRRTVTTLILTATDLVSASIGGRSFLNTYISPYIGGGISLNYAQGVTVFDEEVTSLIRPGVYGVVGVEVPHFFSKYRVKLELRMDRMPDLVAVTYGACISIEF